MFFVQQNELRIYHFQGDSLPDRFEFQNQDRGRMIAAPTSRRVPVNDSDSEDASAGAQCVSTVAAEEKEADARAVAFLADNAVVTDCPMRHSLVGPGQLPGPRRYVGVMKPITLFHMLRSWCADHGLEPSPSFTSFRRALKQSRPWLSFRKSTGQHACCDSCMYFKRKLKERCSIEERQNTMQDYCSHLMDNWRDRQADAAWVALSITTAMAGPPFQANSVLVLRADGLDQAKHKIPRLHQPCKSVENLLRPCCHIQMTWAHGHGFMFGVGDPDMKKNTVSNVDCLARALNQIHEHHGAIPRHIYCIMDNTSRENKNQKMVKWWLKLKVFNIVDHAYMGFAMKGHTHNAIDALGGAACVSTSTKVFDTPEQLQEIYQQFLQRTRFETSLYFKTAFKHDEAADWETWLQDMPLDLSLLTGPRAPHLLHILSRSALTKDDLSAEHQTSFEGAPPPHHDDVMLAVHHKMSDQRPYQLALLIPGSHLPFLRGTCSSALA